jgi:DNA polymerase delta subunit 2
LVQIVRSSAEYKPTYQRFVLKKKNYTQQYSHIYVSRLLQLRDAVLRRIEECETTAPVLPKIIDLRVGVECIIVGTTLKQLDKKPDLFAALTSDEKILSLASLSLKMATPNDELILEDESGRVELTGNINIGELVTGVVLGVRGRMLDGNAGFHVDELLLPSLPPQLPLPERTESQYIALVSGLAIGRDTTDKPLKHHVLMDYLAGRLGGDDEKRFVAQIVRTIFVGNSVDTDSSVAHEPGTMPKTKTTEQLTEDAAPMKNLDELLSTLACAMPVDVMPGVSDPSNHALPQQSFHACLFPHSARFASFRAVTNPYEASVGGVELLGHAGQPLHSILQSTLPADDKMTDGEEESGETDEALDVLERCLHWRNVAPTAPDLLAAFPVEKSDPFVLERCPHVFFAGNAKAFGTRRVQGMS